MGGGEKKMLKQGWVGRKFWKVGNRMNKSFCNKTFKKGNLQERMLMKICGQKAEQRFQTLSRLIIKLKR